MRPIPFSVLLICGLAGLAVPTTGRAQAEGDQDYHFQNILRDVTGSEPLETAPTPAGEAAPDLQNSASSPDAAPSWEEEDAPAQENTAPTSPVPTTNRDVAPDGSDPHVPEQGSVMPIPAPVPSAPGDSAVGSPETGAPIAGIIPLPEPPPAFVDRSSVKLQTLDKATARTMTFEARVGSTVQFGPLFIKVRACRSPPPEDRKESAAFLQIWENTPKSGDPQWIFSGWMFGSSPALSSMDHPIYDVWVISCIEDAVESPVPPAQEED